MIEVHGGIPINPGIVRVVEWMNDHGFKTCDSGDGETHAAECDREHAYVACLVDARQLVSESDRLVVELQLAGVTVEPQGLANDTPYIQASYDPADGTAMIDLCNVSDKKMFPIGGSDV